MFASMSVSTMRPDCPQPSHEKRATRLHRGLPQKAAIVYYSSLGVTVERVMTDNDACYKSFALREACKRLGLEHLSRASN